MPKNTHAESDLRRAIDVIPQYIWSVFPSGAVDFCNQCWLEYTGLTAEQSQGWGWTAAIHPEDRDELVATWRRVLAKGVLAEAEARMRMADGNFRWFLLRATPQRDDQGRIVRWYVTNTDIHDRKRGEEVLASVSCKLIEAQERERTRIARELHDNTNQRLALLAIRIEQLKNGNPHKVPRLRTRLGKIHEQTLAIAKDVQALSHELHSSQLVYLGLVAAMRGFCREFSEHQKGKAVFGSHDLPDPVPPDISLCLFRVLQEALHNAAKHSGAKQFEVQLWGTTNEIHLTVRDSGTGFDLDEARKRPGLGLISMQERTNLVRGTFSIDSRPDAGTTIHVRVPLSRKDHSMGAAGESAPRSFFT